jgi:predicted enzyme related to lactoylglutathione lyase
VLEAAFLKALAGAASLLPSEGLRLGLLGLCFGGGGRARATLGGGRCTERASSLRSRSRFHEPDRTYDAASAATAWRRTVEFLEQRLAQRATSVLPCRLPGKARSKYKRREGNRHGKSDRRWWRLPPERGPEGAGRVVRQAPRDGLGEHGVTFLWKEEVPHGMTAWSPFPLDTTYFGEGSQAVMINYRVDDLDALLEQLAAAGVWIDPQRLNESYGRFAWIKDCDGNRVELWQPLADEA